MALITVRPTSFDITVADGIAAHTGPSKTRRKR